MANDESSATGGEMPGQVVFDFIKGQFFRVIHGDGAIGSMTPGGNIHMAIFSERPAIPRRMVFALDDQGLPTIPRPQETVSRNSIVREIEADVHMSLSTAIAVRDWLTRMIDELTERNSKSEGKL